MGRNCAAALELTYKTASGRVVNELLNRHDEARLESVEQGRPWSFDIDGAVFRLVSEAHPGRLAYLFDPVLVVHTAVALPAGRRSGLQSYQQRLRACANSISQVH